MTQLVTHVETFDSTAMISDCGTYRYLLRRRVLGSEDRRTLAWLMLNPSTADATQDDPTIRKVLGFTSRAGYGRLVVVNLFAWRATDPRAVASMLRRGPGHVGERLARAEGPRNRESILHAAEFSAAVVCAWGAMPWAQTQGGRVVGWLRDAGATPLCLGTAKSGAPLHPLMPSYDAHPLHPYAPTPTGSGAERKEP